MYKYIFFDLDGTLTDPKEGITNCVKYALEHFGIKETDEEKLTSFIGPPLIDTFMNIYNFPEEKALEAVEKYRERFSSKGIFENGVYDGISEMLEILSDSGRIMFLATSKPRVYAEVIVKKYGLRPYLKAVSGSELDGTRNYKHEVIMYLLNKFSLPRDKVIMVGDRSYDIIGAKKCNIASCGVTFGYGSETELKEAGADFIANDIGELTRILLNGNR